MLPEDTGIIPTELFQNFYYRFDGGESGADVFNRFSCFWLELCTLKDNDWEEVWVTHGEIMKVITAKLTGSSIDGSTKQPGPRNGQIVGLELMENGLYRTKGFWQPK
jgi:broad specificity phosphatase PhoE